MLDFATRTPDHAVTVHAPAPPVLQFDHLPVQLSLVSLSLPAGSVALIEGGRRTDRLRLLCIAAGLGFGGPGDCRLMGRSLRDLPREERRSVRQRSVGRVIGVDTLPAGLSTRGAVAVPLLAAGVPPHVAFQRTSVVLEALGIASAHGLRTDALDARQRRLALLARALVGSPPLLVLEDPDESLLPGDFAAVRAALRVAVSVEGGSILMSTSDSRLAALADRRIVLG